MIVRLLMVMLLLMSRPAWAEWVRVTETIDGDVYYVDPAAIKKDDHFRRVWLLINLAKAQEGIASIRSIDEFDCREKRTRHASGARLPRTNGARRACHDL